MGYRASGRARCKSVRSLPSNANANVQMPGNGRRRAFKKGPTWRFRRKELPPCGSNCRLTENGNARPGQRRGRALESQKTAGRYSVKMPETIPTLVATYRFGSTSPSGA